MYRFREVGFSTTQQICIMFTYAMVYVYYNNSFVYHIIIIRNITVLNHIDYMIFLSIFTPTLYFLKMIFIQ